MKFVVARMGPVSRRRAFNPDIDPCPTSADSPVMSISDISLRVHPPNPAPVPWSTILGSTTIPYLCLTSTKLDRVYTEFGVSLRHRSLEYNLRISVESVARFSTSKRGQCYSTTLRIGDIT